MQITSSRVFALVLIASGVFPLFVLLGETAVLLAGVICALIGAFVALYLIRIADRKLRTRGKNGWWLLLFFGPHVVGAFIFERLLGMDDEVLVIVLLGFGILTTPLAIWGAAELTSKPPAQ